MVTFLRVSALEQNLQEVAGDVVDMLSLVRESTLLAKRSLIHGDPAAADECAENDKRIDEVQDRLEIEILTVIARRQPAARDLRFLGAMHRTLADVERAGDYAKHVAQAGAELAGKPRLKKYIDIERILNILIAMIDATVKALAEADARLARDAHSMDDEIDELYEQIQRELLTFMMEDPKTITAAIKLLNVARYLERMGDHFENVNEHIVFWLTGERLQPVR